MLINRHKPEDCACILPSEITPESAYLNRRELLKAAKKAAEQREQRERERADRKRKQRVEEEKVEKKRTKTK